MKKVLGSESNCCSEHMGAGVTVDFWGQLSSDPLVMWASVFIGEELVTCIKSSVGKLYSHLRLRYSYMIKLQLLFEMFYLNWTVMFSRFFFFIVGLVWIHFTSSTLDFPVVGLCLVDKSVLPAMTIFQKLDVEHLQPVQHVIVQFRHLQ